jgi:hypothetical protein
MANARTEANNKPLNDILGNQAGEPEWQKTLRTGITDHCKRMAKLDREYALSAWARYCSELPWLELTKK